MGGFIDYDLGGRAVEVYVSEARTARPLGLVIVIHEVWGFTPFIEETCKRLSRHGFEAAAPAIYSREKELFSPQRLRQGLKLVWHLSLSERYDPERLEAAIKDGKAPSETAKMLRLLYDKGFRASILDDLRLLAARLTSDHRKLPLSAVGFSFGGRLAMELAASFPGLASCIAFSGSPPRGTTLQKIRCPVLLLYGSEDKFMLGELPPLLRDANLKSELTVKMFPSAGHEFFDHTDEKAYSEVASDAAWEASLELLNKAVESIKQRASKK